MGARKTSRGKIIRVDVILDTLQKEFVLRASWDMNRMSQAEFLRTGRIPEDRQNLEHRVALLRAKQRGQRGILGRSL